MNQPSLTPPLFCSDCHRYIGRSEACPFCRHARDRVERIPAMGEPLISVATSGAALGPPLLAGDTALLSAKGSLTALSLSDLDILWRFSPSATPRPHLLYQNGRLYASQRGRDHGCLVALQPNAESDGGVRQAWAYPLPGAGCPGGDGQSLWVGDGEGFLHCLRDAGDHPELLRKIHVDGPATAPPLRLNHLLLIVTRHPNGQVIALDPQRGEIAWRRSLNARGAALLPLSLTPDQPPKAVLVATDQGRLLGYTLPDGDPLGWAYTTAEGLALEPQAHGQQVYLASRTGQIVRLDGKTGQAETLAELEAPPCGMALWHGLLYLALPNQIQVLDAASGQTLQCVEISHGLAGGLAVSAAGLVIAGRAAGGWEIYPWHLGQYAWAAERCAAWGDAVAAAGYLALAGQKEAAAQTWHTAHKHIQTARFWNAQGEMRRAGEAYCQAAEHVSTHYPAEAAAHYNNAADHFERAENMIEQVRACRKKAALIGLYPHLVIDMPIQPRGEAGDLLNATLRLRNLGNAPAQAVQFHLTGDLARLAHGSLEQPIEPNEERFFECEKLIPVVVGESILRLSLEYRNAFGDATHSDEIFKMHISAPPPGTITVQDDAGIIRVRVPKGAPLPNVRVRGMAAVVHYEVTEPDAPTS